MLKYFITFCMVLLFVGTAMSAKVIVKDDNGVIIHQYTFECDPTIPPVEPPVEPPSNEPPNVVTLIENSVLNRISINSGASKYYKFVVTQGGVGHGMQITMGTWDWETNQDMMISFGLPYSTPDDYPASVSYKANGILINGSRKWANIANGTSDETVYIYNMPEGTYYITIHNPDSKAGQFGIRYSAW